MIETQQKVVINAGIDRAWSYAHDINKWANLMPGLQSCTIVDQDNSKWILKVGVGGLVRTVTVLVHVTEWAGPERAVFSYKLEGDPVEGSGAYSADRLNAGESEVTLTVRVVGSGSMAPMWEAMGRPLLPKFAKTFAEQLKAEIEKSTGDEAPRAVQSPSIFSAIWRELRKLWRLPFGSVPR